MKKNLPSVHRLVILGAVAAALNIGSSEVLGQTATYVGTAGTSSGSRTLWSTTGNWTGTAPTDNATVALVFSPPAYNYSNNDINGLTASSITFTGTPQSQDNDITGNAITLAGDVASNTGNYQHVRIAIDMGSTTRNFSVTTGQLELYGVLSGTAGLTKSGASPLVLAGNNTYTGGTTVNNGTVVLTAGGGAGAIRGVVTVNTGATLSSQTGDSFGYNTNTKVDTLNIVGGTVTHNAGGNSTISSATVNMTAGTLQTTGTGGFDLYNNGSGNTTVNTLASSNTATIAGKLNLRQGDNNTTGTVFTVAQGTVSTGIDLNVTAVIANGQFQGVNSVVEKAGAGLMQFTNANTYTGATKVSGGTLVLANQNAVQNSTLTTGLGSVVFDQSVSGNAFTFGGLAGSTGLVLQNNAGTPAAIALTVGGNNANTTYSGVLSGGGSLTKTGTFTTTLTGKSTYTGGTTINDGTLALNTGGSVGAIQGVVTVNTGGTLSSTAGDSFGYNTGTKVNTLNVVGGTVTHNSGNNLTISSATINMTGGTLQSTGTGGLDIYDSAANATTAGNTTINTLASSTTAIIGGKLNLRAGDNDATGTVFTVAQGTVSTAIDLNVTAIVANGASGQGVNSVIEKAGAGLMQLSGANTYTGATKVTGGTLIINGNQSAATGAITVSSSAVLGGSGTVGGSLSLLSGAKFKFSLTDTLTVNGSSVTFGGLSITDLVGLDNTVATGTYTLIGGTAAFNFANVNNFGAGNAYNLGGGKSAYFQSGSLQVVVVPEPATWALLGLGLTTILVFRRPKIAVRSRSSRSA